MKNLIGRIEAELITQKEVNLQYLVQISTQFELHSHLAIFSQPYLDQIFSGDKTVESRFSLNRIAPFQKVTHGDIVFMKESGGKLCGIMELDKVEFFSRNEGTDMKDLMQKYKGELKITDEFIAAKQSANYASFLYPRKIIRIHPITLHKPDRGSWIVLNPS